MATVKAVALDCEMIGFLDKSKRGMSLLAQVSIVDQDGKLIYNEFVKPPPGINYDTLDYRTAYSGITKEILQTRARLSFARVQEDVKHILAGKVVVGHALENDFRALGLAIADYDVRDTAHTPWFMQITVQPRALRRLALEMLGKTIQTDTHNALEDAQTAMELYKKYEDKFTMTVGEVLAERVGKGNTLVGGATRKRLCRKRRTTRCH